jgi:glutathione S-transferase
MNIPLEALTPDERAEFDRAVLAIPADFAPIFQAFVLALRAMHRHDWNQIKNVVEGYQQILDTRYEQEATSRAALEQRIASLEQRMHRLEFVERRATRHQRENEAEDLGQGGPL